MNTLNLIKWQDKEGSTRSFHLVTRISKKWKTIGMLLNYSMEELSTIQCEQNGIDELCWCCLMEKWLLGKGCPSYQATWEGLYSLLADAEALDTAKLLKKAVIQAIHPPSTTEARESSTEQSKCTLKPCAHTHKHICVILLS